LRRGDFIALVAGTAEWPVLVRGQRADKIWQIEFLSGDPAATAAEIVAGFLPECGNLVIARERISSSNGALLRTSTSRDFAAEMLRLKVDVIANANTLSLAVC